jgi:SAM-dependent methyltransferase
VNLSAATTFVSSDGDGYELQMGRWSRRLAPAFIDFAGITVAESVLDLGCGTGNLSFCLGQNPRIASVTGLDLSTAYIEHASRKNQDARVEFRLGDACALPFADASFDHALSMLVLQFIPQPDRAIREMRRVTRPGGTIAAATWDTAGGLIAYRIVFDTAAMLDRDGEAVRAKAYGRPLCRPGELAQAWREAGLLDVAHDMITIRMDFESFADFWAPVEGTEGPAAAYVGTLDPSSKSKLCDAVRLAYLNGEPNGGRSYAATAWVVKGKVP